MNRRVFIRTSSLLAGASLLPMACMRRRTVPGSIVGTSAALGHMVRDGAGAALPPPSETERKEVVIVGGGISGLSAARWLFRHGITDIVVLDLEHHAGGNASCGRNAVSAYPWGAHYIPTPNNELTEYLGFLEEAGVITGRDEKGLPVYNEYHLCFDPQERLYINGSWQDGLVPRSGLSAGAKEEIRRFQAQMDLFRHAKGADGKDAFAIPVDRSSKDPVYTGLDKITMAEWLRQQGYGCEELRWYVDYCTRDDFGTKAEQISAWTGIHYFAGRKGQGANAKYYDTLTWPEGNGWLVEHLCAQIPGVVQPDSLVLKVIPGRVSGETGGGDEGVVVHYMDTRTRKVRAIEARHCIMAVPQFVGGRLLPQDAQRMQTVHEHMHYTPWMVANLTVGKLTERSGQPLSWDNVLYDSESLGYVEATHQQVSLLREKRVLTYYLPLTGGEPADIRRQVQERSHAQWVDLIFEDLRKVHPDIAESTEQVDLMIWGHAMVQPRPGWMHGGVRESLQRSYNERIHYAHTDLAGISIFEEGFYQGIGAAEKVLHSTIACKTN